MENQNLNNNDAISDDIVLEENSTKLAAVSVDILREKGLKISTAESCTSGMLSSLITSVPHSSEIFELGISAYSSRIKEETLSIPADVLREYGAISKETAMYLAKNVRTLSGSDIGVGITGNAGPTADEGKPVGLVFVGIADKNGYFVKELNLPTTYTREKIRNYSSLVALEIVKDYLDSYPAVPSYFVLFDEPISDTAFSTLKPVPAKTQFNTFLPLEDDEDDEDDDILSLNKIPIDSKPDASSYNSFEEDLVEEEVEISSTSEDNTIKKNFFTSFLDKIKFSKSTGAKDTIIKLIFIISLIAFVVSAVVLGYHFISDRQQHTVIDNVQDLYEDLVITQNDVPKLFDVLANENPDIKAWISIPNAAVDHPVYQTDNNEYYLHHNMYKDSSRYGALYFDYRNDVSGEKKSQNLTIYGHNMNDGSMFGTLKKYKSLVFYKDNPTFKVTTPEGVDTYAVFSVMIMNATTKDDNGYLYGFTRSSFSSPEHFMSWIDESLERSLIKTNIIIKDTDQILTLVTCENEKATFENSRLVVMAKKINNEELALASIKAKLNPNPRYPQAWYDAKGLEGYKPNTNSTSSNDSSSDISSVASQSSSVNSSGNPVSSSSVTATSSITTTSSVAPTTSVTPTTTSVAPPVTSVTPPVTSVTPPTTSVPATTSVAPPVTSVAPPVTSTPATSVTTSTQAPTTTSQPA